MIVNDGPPTKVGERVARAGTLWLEQPGVSAACTGVVGAA